MEQEPNALILGVDGGGTNTRAWLARLGRPTPHGEPIEVIGRGIAGPSNPQSLGVQPSAEAIHVAVQRAFKDAGLLPCRVAALSAGLAGAGQPAIAEQVRIALLEAHTANLVRVSDDVSPAWRAARADLKAQGIEPAIPAVVLASGTGAMAWGIDAHGRTARAGGLGAKQGDPGSGYAIGLGALRAKLNLPGVAELQTAESTDAHQITATAQLARAVIDQRDSLPAASTLVNQAVDDLAALVQSVLGQLDVDRSAGYTLVSTGGVLCASDVMRDAVQARLHTIHCPPTHHTRIADPVRGSVLLAEELAQTDL